MGTIYQRGAKGAGVADIQRKLIAKGYSPGSVDGEFGPKTEQAVKEFQQAIGTDPDGIVGPRTLEALNGYHRHTPVADAPWMKLVMAEKGKVAEIPGPENHPVIVEAHEIAGLPASARHDLTSWCASYCKRAFVKSGVLRERLKDFHAWARDYLKLGQKLEIPRYGCVAVYERNGPGGDSHVTFWVGHSGDNDICVGGNQSNQVCQAFYSKKSLLGYRWPSSEMLKDMGAE